MPHLIGERIVLREYCQEDVPDIRKWVNDPGITRGLSDIFTYPHSQANSESFVQMMIDGSSEMEGFVIAHKDTLDYMRSRRRNPNRTRIARRVQSQRPRRECADGLSMLTMDLKGHHRVLYNGTNAYLKGLYSTRLPALIGYRFTSNDYFSPFHSLSRFWISPV
jgi:hypothetical protein